MTTATLNCQCHRFPSEIISHAIWLYHRLCVSFREIEERFAERGVTVAYETVRQWCQKWASLCAEGMVSLLDTSVPLCVQPVKLTMP
jgi:putative transposase